MDLDPEERAWYIHRLADQLESESKAIEQAAKPIKRQSRYKGKRGIRRRR